MDNTTKKTPATKPDKKEARKKISVQIENALPELKELLGEKKFHHRIKKAVKLLTEDFKSLSAGETEDKPEKISKIKAVNVDAATKSKKAVTKKSPAKKATKKVKA